MMDKNRPMVLDNIYFENIFQIIFSVDKRDGNAARPFFIYLFNFFCGGGGKM